MSLHISPDLVDRVRERRTLNEEEFLKIIQLSLPRAWSIVRGLLEKKICDKMPGPVVHDPPHMNEETRGELLRMMASTSIRTAIEDFYGVRLAFQNCHKVGVFLKSEEREFRGFASPVAQVLNQRPELVDC